MYSLSRMSTESWGRLPKVNQQARAVNWHTDPLPNVPEGTLLPYGLGRSYGDSCLNDGGNVLVTRHMDHLLAFDTETGVFRCEAGLSLANILRIIVPHGWFIPVSPGTKFVTVGGAIANDIHGKNHHRAGTFGNHVNAFELMRSDGSRMHCSPNENADYFAATIGGLGLTGLITWAEFRLKKIHNPFVDVETIKLKNLDDFFAVDADSTDQFEYTVSWVDCLAKGASLGRGHYMRGNTAGPECTRIPPKEKGQKPFPIDAPGFLLNTATVKIFNALYYGRQFRTRVRNVQHYEPFFYPLDAIHQWNRMYGKRGFYQYQCVVPYADSRDHIREIFTTIAHSGEGSFLAVLKVFGDIQSPGLLSFPRPGVTLALDFANKSDSTLDLMNRLDTLVLAGNGAVYPAKDARMSAESFRAYFPNWEELIPFIDPKFSSSFWRRVT
ncbi:MAG: FAD/FMN-containing dehydrogenase [Candidatus Omnitrophota bacterium]|jgi:FAD/FMN-containing dehydrogenase